MKYDKYFEKLNEIADKISSYGEIGEYGDSTFDKINTMELSEILGEIETISHNNSIDFNSARDIIDNEKISDALKLIRKFYIYIVTRLETENALTILESDNPKETFDSFKFYDRYIGLINNESRLVEFSEDKTFVFIGSGPLPLTLIMFNETFGCKCIGIEQLEDVAELSKKVLKILDYDEDIEIIVGDERAIEELNYDILMVACFAEPKARVFSNINELIDENTPVIYRGHTGMRAILYAPITDRDTKGFNKEVIMLPPEDTTNSSVLIRKMRQY